MRVLFGDELTVADVDDLDADVGAPRNPAVEERVEALGQRPAGRDIDRNSAATAFFTRRGRRFFFAAASTSVWTAVVNRTISASAIRRGRRDDIGPKDTFLQRRLCKFDDKNGIADCGLRIAD